MRTLFLLLTLLCPTATLAQVLGYACAFEQICVERLSCQPSDLEVLVNSTSETAATLTTGGRELTAQILRDPSLEARSYVTGLEFNTIHLLTIFRDGGARFTIHTPVSDLQSMVHIGQCEIAP
ncbi:MAG: hypothetical protein AAFQ66_02895 [Pseudomonadota bacterium]